MCRLSIHLEKLTVDPFRNDCRIPKNGFFFVYEILFCSALENKVSNWDNESTKIGADFLQFAPYFKMYQSYVANYEQANSLLKKLMDKDSFKEFHDDAIQRCEGAMNLSSYVKRRNFLKISRSFFL